MFLGVCSEVFVGWETRVFNLVVLLDPEGPFGLSLGFTIVPTDRTLKAP